MIITLAGTNAYLIQTELQQLIADFVATYSDIGVERFDGEELELPRLTEALQTLPFLAAKKMVILKNTGRNKTLLPQIETALGEVPDTTELILVEERPDKRTAYYKMLQKKTDFKGFEELDESALISWLVDQARKGKGTLSTKDATYLVQRVGPNQWLLHNELQKLLNYDSAINRTVIDLLTEPLPQSSIFELVDAAFAGDQARTLRLYGEQRRQRVEPLAILGMIAWQLHVIAVVKAAGQRSPNDTASQARLSPFVVRKTTSIARRISIEQLKQWVATTYELDVQLKSSATDADEALEYLLLSFST